MVFGEGVKEDLCETRGSCLDIVPALALNHVRENMFPLVNIKV